VTGLQIAPGLELPIEAVTETFAILAKRGAGKSNAAVVMAEQMHAAGAPWVAIDPKGDWWGIRSSGDGTGAGLPVLVLGGQHGDVPLEATAARLVADLVVRRRRLPNVEN
jgi:DNA helicase HerA-like ATPase